MTREQEIISTVANDVRLFWEWALRDNTYEQVIHGEIDSPSFPEWFKVERHLEDAFENLNFDEVSDSFLDNIIFLIAQQWDIGIVLNWFNKGGEEIGQLGMTCKQLEKLCERGVSSKLVDGRCQLAASLFKIQNRSKAIELLLKYSIDEHEYVRRQSLMSLHRLKYEDLDQCLIKSWQRNQEYERMACLSVWLETNSKLFDQHCREAELDKRRSLREFAIEHRKRLLTRRKTH